MTLRRCLPALFILCWTLWTLGAWAAEPAISEILVHRNNIFDPSISKEAHWPYRLTNSLHIVTREAFIRKELLFKVGDPCDPEILAETERKLRSTGLVNPVSITHELLPDGTCRVDVHTRDVWTTKPGISFSTYSGKTKWGAELEESNLLGLGKNLVFSYLSDVDQHRYLVDYVDPQFIRPTWRMQAGVFKTSEGNGFILSLAQPFDAFTVREAFTASIEKNRQIVNNYWDGKKAFSFISHLRKTTLNYGRKIWENGDSLLRLTGGYQRLEQGFLEPDTLIPGHPFEASPSYTLNMATLAVEFMKVHYLKTQGITAFTSDEDILMGPDFSVSLGVAPGFLGGTRGWTLTGKYQDGIQNGGLLWQRRVQTTLLRIGPGWRGNFLKLDSNLFLRTGDRSNFTLAASLDGYQSPDALAVLYLGAEEGQRGYGYQIVTGSRRWRASIQEKALLWENVLAIANVGIAVFYDAGQVWGWGNSLKDSPVFQDVGVGFRFENLRSKIARVARVDLAYGLHKAHKGWQITVTTGDWFNF
jgi:hypothetical protein